MIGALIGWLAGWLVGEGCGGVGAGVGWLVGSPDGAFAVRVHGRTSSALIGVGEFLRIGQRPEDPNWSRRVNRRTDLGQRILRPHRSAPDLRIVQEKQLVVSQVQTW